MKKRAFLSLALSCVLLTSCTYIPDKNMTPDLSAISEKTDVERFEDTDTEHNTENAPETSENTVSETSENAVDIVYECYPVRLVCIDGQLYYDTGETSTLVPRCGTLDGSITSRCDEYTVPQRNGEANFKCSDDYHGSGWQNSGKNIKEIPLEEGWMIFRKADLEGYSASDFRSCMRVVYGDTQELVFSSEKAVLDDKGDAVYVKASPAEHRVTVPVRYGSVYDWGITMYAKNITSGGMTLVIKQNGGNIKGDINTGSRYDLSVWNGKFWNALPYREEAGNVAWNMLAYLVPKDSEREFDIDWEWLYGELPPGRYRISKEIMDFKAGTEHDEHTYYLDFEITGEENGGNASVADDKNGGLCGYPLAE